MIKKFNPKSIPTTFLILSRFVDENFFTIGLCKKNSLNFMIVAFNENMYYLQKTEIGGSTGKGNTLGYRPTHNPLPPKADAFE